MTKDSRDSAVSVIGGDSSVRRAAGLVSGLGALDALSTLYGWATRHVLRRSLNRLGAGDPGPLFGLYAEDVRLVLSGHHSWAGDYRGKDEVERWMRRFVRVGIQLKAHEILVTGPPWKTTVWLRFTDRLTAADGEIVYANRGIIFGKIVWGRLTYHEVNEDTQRVAEFDEYLALQGLNGYQDPTTASSRPMTAGRSTA
jgi:ketosteroid isomerase-like protein